MHKQLACGLVVLGLALLVVRAAPPPAQSVTLPPDSPRWDLQGQAKVAEYRGRPCLLLDGGAAIVKDLELRDFVLDVDVATAAARGFFGLQFRLTDEGASGEWVYLRPHKSGYPDAMQYTPILGGGANWQIYNGPGFTGAIEIPEDVWMHLRLEVAGAQAKLFVNDMEKPALVMNDLKRGVQKGQVAQPRAATRAGGARHHLVAAGRGGASGLRRPLPVSRGTAPARHVRERLLEAAGAAGGDEGRLRTHRHRIRPRSDPDAADRLQR